MDAKSETLLKDLNQRLAKVVRDVYEHHPIKVIETFRNEQRQNELYDSGRSKLKYPYSKHNTNPALAVDVIPLPLPYKWGAEHHLDLVKFYETAAIVMYEGSRQGLTLRFGGDWDMDGDYKNNSFNDLVHIEIVAIDGRSIVYPPIMA